MNKTLVIWYTILFIALVTASVSVFADNDIHASDYAKHLSSEPEIMQVVYECADEGKLTDEEYIKATTKHLWNVVLDPRDYCESLKEELKEL